MKKFGRFVWYGSGLFLFGWLWRRGRAGKFTAVGFAAVWLIVVIVVISAAANAGSGNKAAQPIPAATTTPAKSIPHGPTKVSRSLVSQINIEPTPDKGPTGYCDQNQSLTAHSWDIIPPVQKAGLPTKAQLWMENHSPTIQNVVLDLHNSWSYWKINSVGSDLGTVHHTPVGDYYAYGPLACGDVLHITLSLTPKAVGKHGFDPLFYTGIDSSSGFPNGVLATAPGERMVTVLR